MSSMGVVHFLLLGASPGAATVGLSYCVENYSRWKNKKREILESVVVVTTEEVVNGKVKMPKPPILNKYGTTEGKTLSNQNSFEILRKFIKEEYKDLIDLNEKDIDRCFVKVDNFKESVVTIASKLSAYRNKEVWLNITGGMNPMTVQALFTAYLGSVVAKIYYTYVQPEYTSLLKPPSKNESEKFQFIEVPMVKSTFDTIYFECLKVIKEKNGKIKTDELKSRLKALGHNIRNDDLLKMRGHGVISEKEDGRFTELTDVGSSLLELFENEKFREYVQFGVSSI